MAIVGHGVDVVDIERFTESLESSPALRDRLFTPLEREYPIASLAARFAAKEALIKALGGSEEMRWIDVEIPRGNGRPGFVFTGAMADRIAALGVTIHLSLSHDGGIATASVIAEKR